MMTSKQQLPLLSEDCKRLAVVVIMPKSARGAQDGVALSAVRVPRPFGLLLDLTALNATPS